jgi:hypothetical protein
VPYENISTRRIRLPPRPPSVGYQRPPRELFRQVPDHAMTLSR